MGLEGKIVNFWDEHTLGWGYVVRGQGDKLQLINQQRKYIRLSEKDILNIYHESVNLDHLHQTLETLQNQVKQLTNEIDIELLWSEIIGHGYASLSAEEISKIYFGKVSPIHVGAILTQLLEDGTYFRFRGGKFSGCNQEDILRIQKTKLLEKEREEKEKAFRNWLKSLEQITEIAKIPEELQILVQQIESAFRSGYPNDAWKLLEKVADEETTPEELAFDILVKTGRISPGSDAILQIAGISRTFPDKIMQYVEEYTPPVGSSTETVEWSTPYAFSIDDPDTQEVDDAITWKQEGSQTEIGIHIADVSYFIFPGDPVDELALRRCATIYLPTGTIYMIPPKISCNLASLHPGNPKPVFSLIIRVDKNYRILNWEFKRGTLIIKRRLSYEEADQLITQGNDEWGACLRNLWKITQQFQEKRLRAGAIIFDKQELKVKVHDGQINISVFPCLSPSRSIIAELMILYNHLAAEFAKENHIPIIYRAQEEPDEPAKGFVGRIVKETYPAAFRGLKKGRLTLRPQSHSGLGITGYTQVSSPLRRFADLVIQRQLIAFIEQKEKYPYEPNHLLEVLANAEFVEREYREIEKRMTRYWELEFLSRQPPNQEYDAVVMNKLPGSYLVALKPWPIRGLLNTTQTFKFGEEIRVKIDCLNANLGIIRLKLTNSLS